MQPTFRSRDNIITAQTILRQSRPARRLAATGGDEAVRTPRFGPRLVLVARGLLFLAGFAIVIEQPLFGSGAGLTANLILALQIAVEQP